MNTQEFVDLVNKKIADNIPFSLIRYGDGEAIMLDDNKDNKKFVLKRQFGFIPPLQHELEIVNNLKIAYSKTDCIGVPIDTHLNRQDLWKSSLNVLKNHIELNTKTITSVDVCYDMLYSKYLDSILQNKDTVNYISCRNIDNELKNKYSIKNVNSYIIAPEAKFTSGYNGLNHFPNQFNEIEKWVKTIPCRGNLCLVGAGVVGKIYNIWFKDQGGISLDIGGVFDLWAGRVTRGVDRGVNVIDNTYKL